MSTTIQTPKAKIIGESEHYVFDTGLFSGPYHDVQRAVNDLRAIYPLLKPVFRMEDEKNGYMIAIFEPGEDGFRRGMEELAIQAKDWVVKNGSKVGPV